MEILNGTNLSSLKEAYAAVYDNDLRTKLEENREVKEFSEFINLLIDEGYDLSEYTYDDLYEYYISEGKGKAALQLLQRASGFLKKAGGQVVSGMKEPGKQTLQKLGSGLVKVGVPAGVAAGIDQFVTGGKGREWTGAAVQGVRQLGHSIPSPGQQTPPTATQKPPKPKSQQERNPFGLQKEDFDSFDMIKEHLLDEGYADTEEAALAIMANMSEGWKQSILESLDPDEKGATHSYGDAVRANEKAKKMKEKYGKDWWKMLPRSGPGSQAKDA